MVGPVSAMDIDVPIPKLKFLTIHFSGEHKLTRKACLYSRESQEQKEQNKLLLQEEVKCVAVLTSNREEISWEGKGQS